MGQRDRRPSGEALAAFSLQPPVRTTINALYNKRFRATKRHFDTTP